VSQFAVAGAAATSFDTPTPEKRKGICRKGMFKEAEAVPCLNIPLIRTQRGLVRNILVSS